MARRIFFYRDKTRDGKMKFPWTWSVSIRSWDLTWGIAIWNTWCDKSRDTKFPPNKMPHRFSEVWVSLKEHQIPKQTCAHCCFWSYLLHTRHWRLFHSSSCIFFSRSNPHNKTMPSKTVPEIKVAIEKLMQIIWYPIQNLSTPKCVHRGKFSKIQHMMNKHQSKVLRTVYLNFVAIVKIW